jgi:diaminohydroxyphosphoribosylaminopyrimidine deaminase/5-amino-6-(5-phosphoribosylamino)uracil reductase
MGTPELYMRRCLELAQKGAGKVAPNPMVGAVLVHSDRIIGEGWHQQYGAAHAEVNCLLSVAPEAAHFISESTLYVNLEPCSHFGKTPPCADLILRNKIPKVVIGSIDSFAGVSGKGIERLKNAGVEVVTGVLEKECRTFNRRFFTVQEKKRPDIILKWAQSAEGFIAPASGVKTRLSNDSSQKLVHKMRSEEAAILVGYNTALKDNPQLNDRFWNGGQPIRIVFDPENKLPEYLFLFQPLQKTIIFNFRKNEIKENKEWIKVEHNQNPALGMINRLKEIQSVIVEGGSKTLQLFIDAGLWDEALIFKTPVLTGGGLPAPLLTHSKAVSHFHLGGDHICLQAHERNDFYL